MTFSTTVTTWFNNRAVNGIRKGRTFMGMRLVVLNTVGNKTGAHPEALSTDGAGIDVPVAAARQFLRYGTKSDRVIPVIQLTRR